MNKRGQAVVGVVGGIIVFVVLMVLLLGINTVDATHLGVKNRFGVITGVQQPGMEYVGIFTSVDEYDMRERKLQIDLDDTNSAVDKTGQEVYAIISVNYRLKRSNDVVKNLYANVGRDRQIANVLNIEPLIIESFKMSTAKFDSMEILDDRQQVKDLATENIRKNFPTEYFEITRIVIGNIDFSDDFKKAIEEKKVATQNKLKEKEQLDVVKFQQQQEIEKYKAEAEKLRLQKTQITALLNEQKMIDRWNGVLPQTLIIQDGSQGLFLQLAQGKQLTQSTATLTTATNQSSS